MKRLMHGALARNHHPDLDLFARAAEYDRRHRAPYHVRRVARRHNISESRAALVCEIAGIGGEE